MIRIGLWRWPRGSSTWRSKDQRWSNRSTNRNLHPRCFCGRRDDIERRSMRKFGWLARWITGCLAAAALAGCGSSTPDATAPGPVDPGLYHDALLDNQQRVAGEDVRVVPLYKTPFEAFGVGLDLLIGR